MLRYLIYWYFMMTCTMLSYLLPEGMLDVWHNAFSQWWSSVQHLFSTTLKFKYDIVITLSVILSICLLHCCVTAFLRECIDIWCITFASCTVYSVSPFQVCQSSTSCLPYGWVIFISLLWRIGEVYCVNLSHVSETLFTFTVFSATTHLSRLRNFITFFL